MYIYYPSCNFKKLFPETAKRIAEYLQTQPDVILAGCCKQTTSIPRKGDVIVTICNSCMRLLAEMREDVEQISFYEFLLTREDIIWPDLEGETYTLQDCFRARGRHAQQDSVRECLVRMHAQVVEMEHNRDEEDFDGSFLLHPPYPSNEELAPKYFRDYLPAHVTELPREEWETYMIGHAGKYRTGKVVCYCNTCTSGAREGGAEAFHLAELIFEK